MTALAAPLVYAAETIFVRVAFFEDRWAIWWPMNGVALGALLLIRRRHWPWVLIAFAVGIALSERRESVHVVLMVAVCNLLEVLAPAFLLPGFRTMDKWLAAPGLAVRFILVAILAAPAGSSLIAPLYFHTWQNEPYWTAVLRWGAGDVLGIALFTPLVLALFSPEMWLLFRLPALPRTVVLLTLMSGASWFIFHQNTLPLAFTIYPIILMVGTQLGLSGAAIAINVLACISTTATLGGNGPFGAVYGGLGGPRVLVLQIFLVLSLSMTLPISIARVRRLTTEAELKCAWQKMEALASLDGLTGVANRRRFDTALSLEWARAERERIPLALLLIDADHFKAFNDHYGHLAGDACLRSIAAAIAGVSRRPHDLVARYGGEEFAVLLPASDTAGAEKIAEMVRLAVCNLAMPHLFNVGDQVTVSIGFAVKTPASRANAEELIAAADKALYRAKDKGRNQVRSADESLESMTVSVTAAAESMNLI